MLSFCFCGLSSLWTTVAWAARPSQSDCRCSKWCAVFSMGSSGRLTVGVNGKQKFFLRSKYIFAFPAARFGRDTRKEIIVGQNSLYLNYFSLPTFEKKNQRRKCSANPETSSGTPVLTTTRPLAFRAASSCLGGAHGQ